jgi:hypothetical protein
MESRENLLKDQMKQQEKLESQEINAGTYRAARKSQQSSL